ncbi:MAG: hypothetical protein KTR16_02430 [Acidiferrobacterales bacterium]|nr:hypothetical protein [Acidiferrobacterales bacterium]
MPTYIRCDGPVSQTNNGVWTRCRNDEGVMILDGDPTQGGSLTQLTPAQVSELSSWLWLCCSIAYGGRLILRSISFR